MTIKKPHFRKIAPIRERHLLSKGATKIKNAAE
jgi:hypothetical protein